MCRFLRTSKSSCGALTLIIFALFPRSLVSLLSSSLVSSSLLPLFSSNRLLGPMTSICESSCLPYLFSAFYRVNMQSELWCRETTKPTDMQNKLSLDLTLRNLIRGGLGNPSDLKKKKNTSLSDVHFPILFSSGLFVCFFWHVYNCSQGMFRLFYLVQVPCKGPDSLGSFVLSFMKSLVKTRQSAWQQDSDSVCLLWLVSFNPLAKIRSLCLVRSIKKSF